MVFGSGYDKVGAFTRQLQNFAGAIRGREPLRITGEDAIASVEVIEAAYESLARDHWVPVAGSGSRPRPARVRNLARPA